VVDDEEVVRRSCLRVLGEAGYEVDTADDGAEALRRVKKKTYDLIILDVMMPEIDGFTVLQSIRSDRPDAKFIIITGMNQVEMSIRAAEFGAAAYIGKPFGPDELLAKVKHVLENRS